MRMLGLFFVFLKCKTYAQVPCVIAEALALVPNHQILAKYELAAKLQNQ
jgi:hypothetical protein